MDRVRRYRLFLLQILFVFSGWTVAADPPNVIIMLMDDVSTRVPYVCVSVCVWWWGWWWCGRGNRAGKGCIAKWDKTMSSFHFWLGAHCGCGYSNCTAFERGVVEE